MSLDEIKKKKLDLEVELRGQMARGNSLMKEFNAVKTKVSELKGGIAALDLIVNEDVEPEEVKQEVPAQQ